MGLPSGNRWAVSNLDISKPYFFQESPFQYECSFFSWGNVTPHNPISETEFDYNFGGVNSAAPYYEGQPYGDTQGSMLTGNIQLAMDAARKMLGSPWRMPESKDFGELFNNSIYIDANGNELDPTLNEKRVTVNDVLGIYLESKINGARIFFPCAGYGLNQAWGSRGNFGYYWSIDYVSSRDARRLYIRWAVAWTASGERCRGCAIRPIWNPRDLRG